MIRLGSGSQLLTQVLAPFGVRSFRFQWPADLTTSLAFEMETLILGWYVLVESGSVVWLTAFGALLFHGTLISPVIGAIGDRIGHRNLLCSMRAIYFVLALVMMFAASTGVLGPGLVLCLAALAGLVRPSDLAVRGATVAATMPAPQLVGAMGISRSTSDMARMAGALLGAGLLARLGMVTAYAVIAGCYATGLLFTLLIAQAPTVRHDGAAPSAKASVLLAIGRDLVEGMGYVRSTPRLLAAMWLAFLMNMTLLPLSGGLLPFVARGVYHIDQTGLGYLSASFAFGSLIGSAIMSVIGARIRLARTMMAATIIWSLILMVYARSGTMGEGIVLLALAGVTQSLCMVTMAVMLLKTSEVRLRGRVMGVRMLAIFSQTFGLMAAGWLIMRFGFGATAMALAGSALACTVLILMRWEPDLWPETAIANAR